MDECKDLKSSEFNSSAEEAPQTNSNWMAREKMPLAKTERELRMEKLLTKAVETISVYKNGYEDIQRILKKPVVQITSLEEFLVDCEKTLAEK